MHLSTACGERPLGREAEQTLLLAAPRGVNGVTGCADAVLCSAARPAAETAAEAAEARAEASEARVEASDGGRRRAAEVSD